MPPAFGQRFLLHQTLRGGWVFVVAVIVAILLLRFWPSIVASIERRRSR